MRSSPLLIFLVLGAGPALAQPQTPADPPHAQLPPNEAQPGQPVPPANPQPTQQAPGPVPQPPGQLPPGQQPVQPPAPMYPPPGWTPGAQPPPGQPYGQPPQPWARPSAPHPGIVEREKVSWFARVEIGLGSPGFQENNGLLNDLGYARLKMWATLDAAYMFHRHVGAGIWMGMNRRASQPGGQTLDLNSYGFFIGGELPIRLWGKRAYTFQLTPRVGYLNGTTEVSNGTESQAQHAPIFGAAVSFQSFTYHLGVSLGWMFAPAGSPGEIGRDHDYGGIYAALGGTIDG